MWRFRPGWMLPFLLVGCGFGAEQSLDPNQLYVVRHASADAAPLALAEGVLERRGPCLFIGETLLIWPESYTVDASGTAILGDGFRLSAGDRITVGGGGYERLSELPSRVMGPAPPCPGPYFWVSKTRDVLPGGS